MTTEPIDWRIRAVAIATETEWSGRNGLGLLCCPLCDGVPEIEYINWPNLANSKRYHRGHTVECLIALTLRDGPASDTGATQEDTNA